MFNILFLAREYDSESTHHVIHDDIARRLISDAAFEWSIDGYTIIESSGLWQGCAEEGYVLLLWNAPVISLDGFILALKTKLKQKEILHLRLDETREIPNLAREVTTPPPCVDCGHVKVCSSKFSLVQSSTEERACDTSKLKDGGQQ
jgi:hypothetical protein